MKEAPKRGGWLVYINGLEIPCSRVTVSYGVWMIPEAEITLAPHRLLNRLGAQDRLEVAIFFLDVYTDPELPVFRLLFEGDIVGWTNSAGGRQRAQTFKCVGDMSILQQVLFYFINNTDSIAESVLAAGADLAAKATGLSLPFSWFQQGLMFKSAEDKPNITRPYEFLNNIPLSFVVQEIAPEQKTVPCVNFFSRWMQKRNFLNRFVPVPVLEDVTATANEVNPSGGVFPIFQAAKKVAALELLRTTTSSAMSMGGNVWETLKMMLGIVYMEVAMIPTAPLFKCKTAEGDIIGSPKDTDTAGGGVSLKLANYYVKPQFLFALPPLCNVVFPSMQRSSSYEEHYLTQPTRVYVNEEFLESQFAQSAITRSAFTLGHPEVVNEMLLARAGDESANSTPSDPKRTGKSVLVYPEELFKGPVVAKYPLPRWFYLLKQAEETSEEVTDADGSTKTDFKKLFEAYARYEYYRSRYEKRGGFVESIFNPFILPGYPCVVFDRRSSRMDTYGYVMTVKHDMMVGANSGAMSTTVGYSFGRTVQEVLEEIKSHRKDYPKDPLLIGPADPIVSIRDVMQQADGADKVYRSLIYGDSASTKKTHFDVTDGFAYVDDSQARTYYENDYPKTKDIDLNTIDLEKELTIKEGYRPYLNDTDAAMQKVARPICTLQEYVRFMQAGKPPGGVGAAELSDRQDFGDEVVYYKRIYKRRPGPAPEPTKVQLGAEPQKAPDGSAVTTATGAKAVTLHTEENIALSDTYPQTILDWDKYLEEYREFLYSRMEPQL